MASIHKTIPISRPAAEVWSAVSDTGRVHERLARDFVTGTTLQGDTRLVTFANGLVARELVVDVDGAERRVAYSVVESPLGMRHHHASMQVLPDGEGACSLVWIADVAPDDVAGTVGEMMDLGARAMQRTLEGVS
jgi:hypothetical protein